MTRTTKPLTPAEVLERERKKAKREGLELAMVQQLRASCIPFGREHRFHALRAWRFDFVFGNDERSPKLALEVEGGTWSGGAHTRGKGYAEDCEKYAEAAILGWRVLRATTDQVKSGMALSWVQRALQE